MTRTKLWSERARTVYKGSFATPTPDITHNFDQGLPAPESYPRDVLADCARHVLAEDGVAACAYYAFPGGRIEMEYGYLGLREHIARRLSRRDGRMIGADGVLLSTGSSGGLALIAAAFIDPGDAAIVEETTFAYMVRYMRTAGAEIATVPVTDDGMDLDALEQRLEELRAAGRRPKIIYTIPTFQVPTGTVMPLQNRLRLLAIAARWQMIVVEDNCYYELCYDHKPPPTLLSLDRQGIVLQTDSFSKMIAPGLRIGWVAGPPDLIAALAAMRQDLGASQLVCRIIAEFIARGQLDLHLDFVRPLYRAKRDEAVAALHRHCADFIRFRVPQGGIFFWLRLVDGIDCAAVQRDLAQQGIACRPGEQLGAGADRFLRMSFLQVSAAELEHGVAALGQALARHATMGQPLEEAL